MAELVDAPDSKSGSGDRVWVRVPPPAPHHHIGIETQLNACADWLVKGGGFGLLGNIVIGIIGGFIFGAIVSATIGAVVLLIIVRALKKACLMCERNSSEAWV